LWIRGLIGNNDCYGNIVVSLFKITVIRDINGFNSVLKSFKVFDVESVARDIAGWEAVTLAYDWPDGGECDA